LRLRQSRSTKILSLNRPAPVHADGDSVDVQHGGEIIAGELTTLIGVEDRWPALAQSVLQGFDAEARIEQVRQAPSQHVPADPVHNRDQIEKVAPVYG
jgi:hypothetical protein